MQRNGHRRCCNLQCKIGNIMVSHVAVFISSWMNMPEFECPEPDWGVLSQIESWIRFHKGTPAYKLDKKDQHSNCSVMMCTYQCLGQFTFTTMPLLNWLIEAQDMQLQHAFIWFVSLYRKDQVTRKLTMFASLGVWKDAEKCRRSCICRVHVSIDKILTCTFWPEEEKWGQDLVMLWHIKKRKRNVNINNNYASKRPKWW